jgi:hypothetical protein
VGDRAAQAVRVDVAGGAGATCSLGFGNQALTQIDVAGAAATSATSTTAPDNGAVQNLPGAAVELHTGAAIGRADDGTATEPIVAVAGLAGGRLEAVGLVKAKGL